MPVGKTELFLERGKLTYLTKELTDNSKRMALSAMTPASMQKSLQQQQNLDCFHWELQTQSTEEQFCMLSLPQHFSVKCMAPERS